MRAQPLGQRALCVLALLLAGFWAQASAQSYYQPQPWGYPYYPSPPQQPAPDQQGAQPAQPQPAAPAGWPSQGAWPGQPGLQQPQGQPYQQPQGQPYQQPQGQRYQQPGYGQPWGAQPQNPWGRQPGAAPQQPGTQNPWGQPGGAYAQPSRPGATSQPRRNAPRVELKLAERRPYVQQPVVLTLRVFSADSLATLNPEMPGGDVIFKRLGDPVTRMEGGEVLNEYHYAMTALSPGNLILPPVRITGTHRGGGDFEASAPSPLVLNARPAESNEDYRWLPLHGLVLQTYLQNAENPAAGKPVSLVVDLSAVGATGAQLPSMEAALQSPDYRIYREESAAEGQVSGDGEYLLGQRTETFTLVPLHGGRVKIPGLRIGWWNVDTERWEVASTPIRQLVASGEPGEVKYLGGVLPDGGSLVLWVPLGAVFALTIGFWVLAWLRKKRFVQVVEEESRFALRFAARRFHLFLIWLSPIRRLQRVRQIFVRYLPKSFRLWFCVRLVSHEDDPETWAYMLRFLANKHLGVPPQESMVRLGDHLMRIHRGADPAAMRRLMEHLDAALYGRGEIGDFAAWKKAFRRQLRPRLLGGVAQSTGGSKPGQLPALNP